MKEQYVGDVNDYRKYALLRMLCVEAELRLGICWMLTGPDGRTDGNKVGYLEQPQKWRPHDPELFDLLSRVGRSPDTRRLASLEQSGLFPRARFFNSALPDELESRQRYFDQAQNALGGCDVVFFDPDNGLNVPSIRKGNRNSSKYLYDDEIASFWDRGASVLIYQHHPFEKIEEFSTRSANRLTRGLPGSKVNVFREAHATFFLASQAKHTRAIRTVITTTSAEWPAWFILSREWRDIGTTNELLGTNLPLATAGRSILGTEASLEAEVAEDVMVKARVEDICEARLTLGTEWEVLSIEEALQRRNLCAMRCIECKGEVRPHKGARNGVFRPHFEHRVWHIGCSRCSRARGAQTPHPTPAR